MSLLIPLMMRLTAVSLTQTGMIAVCPSTNFNTSIARKLGKLKKKKKTASSISEAICSVVGEVEDKGRDPE